MGTQAQAKKRLISFERDVLNPGLRWISLYGEACPCLTLRAELFRLHALLREAAQSEMPPERK